jgi:hypothetical protein
MVHCSRPECIHVFSFRTHVTCYQGDSFVSVHRGSFLLLCFNITLHDGFPNPRYFNAATLLPPREFPPTGFKLIDPSQSVEEEQLPFYNRGEYYPMRIGAVIKDRYQVVGKLGYGTSSTVWLCHDLRYALLPSFEI